MLTAVDKAPSAGERLAVLAVDGLEADEEGIGFEVAGAGVGVEEKMSKAGSSGSCGLGGASEGVGVGFFRLAGLT